MLGIVGSEMRGWAYVDIERADCLSFEILEIQLPV